MLRMLLLPRRPHLLIKRCIRNLQARNAAYGDGKNRQEQHRHQKPHEETRAEELVLFKQGGGVGFVGGVVVVVVVVRGTLVSAEIALELEVRGELEGGVDLVVFGVGVGVWDVGVGVGVGGGGRSGGVEDGIFRGGEEVEDGGEEGVCRF